jgi:hypothetical protein
MKEEHAIREQLEQWAIGRRLAFHTFEHWDALASRALLEDSAGDIYEFWAAPETLSGARVGVTLVKRGSSKHHALRRERTHYSHNEDTPITRIPQALESCFAKARFWVEAAGHELPSQLTAGA